MILELEPGKQIVLTPGWLQIFANGGSLGVQMTADQMRELYLEAYQLARRMKRSKS